MQITLNQAEIEDAIRSFVLGHISVTEGTDIAIDLKAGRGENGFTASLELNRSTYAGSNQEDSLPERDPAAEVPIPDKTKSKKTKAPEPEAVEETSEEAPEEQAAAPAEEDPMTSADCIPDAPEEEEKAEESPRKPSIFQFNAAKQPAE